MTVELAIGMAALIAVLSLLVGAMGAMRTQAEVCQAVREGARAAAVGESAPAAVASSFPRAVGVTVNKSGGWVTVSASSESVLGVSLACSASTLAESGI